MDWGRQQRYQHPPQYLLSVRDKTCRFYEHVLESGLFTARTTSHHWWFYNSGCEFLSIRFKSCSTFSGYTPFNLRTSWTPIQIIFYRSRRQLQLWHHWDISDARMGKWPQCNATLPHWPWNDFSHTFHNPGQFYECFNHRMALKFCLNSAATPTICWNQNTKKLVESASEKNKSD